MIIKLLKILLSVVYILAAISVFVPLFSDMTLYLHYFVIAVLLAHVVEVLVFMENIKKYPGALSTSVVLTILYGFLHWLPLRQQAEAKQ